MGDTPDAQKKNLVLHIEIPDIWADDLDESASYFADGPPSSADRLAVVIEEWMRPDVGLTIVTIPGDKCMNDDFEVHAFKARIVGAEAVDRG